LQLERVDARCTWLLHADLDSMRASEAGRELLRVASAETEELFGTLRTKLGVDLASEVRGMTLYGPSLRQHAGVTLLDIEPGSDLSPFDALPAFDEADASQASALRVIEDEATQKWFVAQRERDTRTVVIIGDDAAAVLRAIDVLEGRRASMRTSVVLGMLGAQLTAVDGAAHNTPAPKWPFDQLPTLMQDRVMFTLAIAELPAPPQEVDGNAKRPLPTIARVQGVLARIGEVRDETQAAWVEADLQVRMRDQQSAADMQTLMQRVLALMASPKASDDETGEAPDPLQGMELTRTDNTVRLSAKERVEEMLASLRTGDAQRGFGMLRVLRNAPASGREERATEQSDRPKTQPNDKPGK
jgi:hypothetical protein